MVAFDPVSPPEPSASPGPDKDMTPVLGGLYEVDASGQYWQKGADGQLHAMPFFEGMLHRDNYGVLYRLQRGRWVPIEWPDPRPPSLLDRIMGMEVDSASSGHRPPKPRGGPEAEGKPPVG